MENSIFHKPVQWIITCEHSGNLVPEQYGSIYTGFTDLLNSHRGWDPGAAELADEIAHELKTKALHYPYTRLLIEPNRSLNHSDLFSEISRNFGRAEKQHLIEHFYKPYRNRLAESITATITKYKQVTHLSVHTFTPVWDGLERTVDIGLLYDPKKKREKVFCNQWRSRLRESLPQFQISMNQPYRGSSDGLTTSLRKVFPEQKYLGIELEANQKFLMKNRKKWQKLCKIIAGSLADMEKGWVSLES